jgi:hypothetical protein
MIRYFGRSLHTHKTPNKPVSQGYKLYGLADHKYVWYWLCASRLKSMIEVSKEEGRIMTGLIIYQLLQKLTHEPGCYIVYLDNYFTSINLFKRLRNEGI